VVEESKMSESPETFHLAWHRLDVPKASEYLIYTLVPSHVRAFKGSLKLHRISFSGVEIDDVMASAFDLASPRRAECPEGEADPVEVRLIRHLQIRAGRAQNILPAIVPARTSRDWSRLSLGEGERRRLLRAGGAE
jgi:hypothetical protein